MEVLNWILGIVMFVVALSFIVAIHELGHLLTAKMFGVYCFDYSIGFGPKLYQSKLREGQETTFTIRAIPLGGFVSMYGEGVELEQEIKVAPNRNLEGVAKWKRFIIFSAGIFLNFILGFALIFIANQAFEHPYIVSPVVNQELQQSSLVIDVVEDSDIYSLGIKGGDAIRYINDPSSNYIILDQEVIIENEGEEFVYVLTYPKSLPTSLTDPIVSDDLHLFIARTELTEAQEEIGLQYAPNVNNEYTPTIETYNGISIDLDFYVNSGTSEEPKYDLEMFETKTFNITADTKNNEWKDFGLNIKVFHQWYDFPTAMRVSWNDFAYANTAVFEAVGGLFIGTGWDSLGGPVAILTQSTTALTAYGFGSYLYLWGFISCNLAILNLLPFPGLDGWHLLVVSFEGITRKKIPSKYKNIVATVGILLLFALMFFVFIKDIIGLF